MDRGFLSMFVFGDGQTEGDRERCQRSPEANGKEVAAGRCIAWEESGDTGPVHGWERTRSRSFLNLTLPSSREHVMAQRGSYSPRGFRKEALGSRGQEFSCAPLKVTMA